MILKVMLPEGAKILKQDGSNIVMALNHRNQIITGEQIGVSLIPVQGSTLKDFEKNDSLDGGSVVVDDDTGEMRLEKW